MIRKILTALYLLLSTAGIAQIGIGTNTPDTSALLDLQSTTRGVLVPRLTAAQKLALYKPATGLLIYQTDGQAGFYFNAGTRNAPSWIAITGNQQSAQAAATQRWELVDRPYALATVPKEMLGMAFDGTHIWGISNNPKPQNLFQLDAGNLENLQVRNLDFTPSRIIFDGNSLCVLGFDGKNTWLHRFSPLDGSAIDSVMIPDNPLDITTDGTLYWILYAGVSSTIYQYNHNLSQNKLIPVPTATSVPSLIYDGQYLWVANSNGSGTTDVTRIDPADSKNNQTTHVSGFKASSMSFDGVNLWLGEDDPAFSYAGTIRFSTYDNSYNPMPFHTDLGIGIKSQYDGYYEWFGGLPYNGGGPLYNIKDVLSRFSLTDSVATIVTSAYIKAVSCLTTNGKAIFVAGSDDAGTTFYVEKFGR